MKVASKSSQALWNSHSTRWRQPLQIVSIWENSVNFNPKLLESRVSGKFWEALEETRLTLVVTREYEHLVMAFSVPDKDPIVSFLNIPHPSGTCFNSLTKSLILASTRNPNQLITLKPGSGFLDREDLKGSVLNHTALYPVRTDLYPGSLYIHELAIIQNKLYANAVAHNAIVKLSGEGKFDYSWWPKCIDNLGKRRFNKNYLQLNSIAPGNNLRSSYFCASVASVPRRYRPGHVDFEVDKKGVIFSGKTREPVATGLTRPHSARLYRRKLWVNNSGYGELGVCSKGSYEAVLNFPGWTRGLFFSKHYAFVGTSRVIPKFRKYAPGLALGSSVCGLHIVDLKHNRVIGRIIWPSGNQIFSVEGLPNTVASGFPFLVNKRSLVSERNSFYSFSVRI